ncbi:MAG: PcfK-like family protein [bacterium]|nr:PcfK-like family protein [bacterium]
MNLEEKLISKDKQCQIVCDYLKELCNSDEYLRNAILEKENNSVDGMWNYIKDKAKKEAINGCACIEDNTVFSWARDYWLDVVDTKQKEPVHNDIAEKTERIVAKHVKQKIKEENDKKFNSYYESDLFGGLV